MRLKLKLVVSEHILSQPRQERGFVKYAVVVSDNAFQLRSN